MSCDPHINDKISPCDSFQKLCTSYDWILDIGIKLPHNHKAGFVCTGQI